MADKAGPPHRLGVQADGGPPVERKHIVLRGLHPPQVLQLAQLVRMLRGEVVRLREVLVDLVEFPGRLVGIELGAIGVPGHERRARGHPAVVIEAAVAAQLEVLGLAPTPGRCVIEGEGEAQALDRLLLHAVQLGRRGDPADLVQRRHDVDRVQELRSQSPLVPDPRRPGDDHRIASPAEMAGDLFGPLERRVHRVGPGRREVVEMPGPAQFVDGLEVVLPPLGKAVEEQVLAERTFEPAFGARPVVAGDIDDQGVVGVRHGLDGVDHAAELVVAMGAIGGEDLHHPRIETLLVGVQRIPCRKPL